MHRFILFQHGMCLPKPQLKQFFSLFVHLVVQTTSKDTGVLQKVKEVGGTTLCGVNYCAMDKYPGPATAKGLKNCTDSLKVRPNLVVSKTAPTAYDVSKCCVSQCTISLKGHACKSYITASVEHFFWRVQDSTPSPYQGCRHA